MISSLPAELDPSEGVMLVEADILVLLLVSICSRVNVGYEIAVNIDTGAISSCQIQKSWPDRCGSRGEGRLGKAFDLSVHGHCASSGVVDVLGTAGP